jgi:hypothetical protein
MALVKECTHPGCMIRQPEGTDYWKCLGCGARIVKIIPGTEDAVSWFQPVEIFYDEVELLYDTPTTDSPPFSD